MIDEEILETPSEDESLLGDFLDNLGTSVSEIRIYRVLYSNPGQSVPKVGPKGGIPFREHFVDTVTPPVTEVQIRDAYGAGSYRLYFHIGSKKVASKMVHIGPLRMDEDSTQDLVRGPGQKAGKVDMPTMQLDFLRDQMAQQQTLILALIQGMQGSHQQVDIGSILQGMAQMQQATKPNAVADPATLLTAVTSAFSVLKGAAGEGDLMEKAQSLLGLAKELAPSKDHDDNLYSVVREIGNKVVDTFGGREAGSREPRSNPAKPAALPPAPAPQQQEEDVMQRWIRAQLDFLKHKAKAGKPVEFWLDYMFENQEEPGVAAILNAIQSGATFDHLLAFDSEIRDNPALRSWFERFYLELRGELLNPGPPAMDTAGPGRNDSNAPNYASTGAASQPDPGSPQSGAGAGKPAKS